MMTLPIKAKWYDMILSGEKKEEYRNYSSYWITRFYNAGMLTLHHGVNGIFYKAKRNTRKLVRFRNGYSADSRSFVAEVRLHIGYGKPQWGAKQGEKYLVLTILSAEEEIHTQQYLSKPGDN